MAAPTGLRRIGPATYELGTDYRPGMRVPVRVFAGEKLLGDQIEPVRFEQFIYRRGDLPAGLTYNQAQLVRRIEQPIQMIIQPKHRLPVASHRFKQPHPVQQTGVVHADMRLVRLDEPIV